MIELRQSTAKIQRLGPIVNSTGVTPVTNLTIDAADEAEWLKNGTTGTLAIAGTLTAIANADGYYYLTIAATDCDQLGDLILAINDDSACLPYRETFSVVEQGYYDTKYNSTGSFKASLTAAVYASIGAFRATGFSTFDPATQGVTLTNAIYDSIGAWQAGLSTFNPTTQGVTLASAVYASIGAFKADVSGLSTFDPAVTGVTLASAVYASIGAFKADLTTLNDISVADIIAGVADGAYDLQEMLRLITAACVGKLSGGSTTTITIRDISDTKNRIVATVDENGNRTALTLDAS